MSLYKPLPESGKTTLSLGFYMSKYGRVWVSRGQPGWVHDTATTGHEEETFETELEGCGWVYPSLVSVDQIIKGFEERNLERKTSSPQS